MKLEPGAPIEFGLSGVSKRLEKLNKIYPIKFQNCLDFGAGKGAYSFELKRNINKVYAFDINPEYIFYLKERVGGANSIYPFITSASKPAIKSQIFEAVFLIEVIEHVEDLEECIAEIYRISRENAVIYVTVPNKYFILETHMVNIFGFRIRGRYIPLLCCFDFIHNKIGTARRFSIKNLKMLFEQFNFSLIGTDYMMPPFDNIKIAQNQLKKISEILQNSFLRFFSSTVIAVFRKN